MPIPDVTTLSGRRICFSHIDGDGWNNVSLIEAYRDKPTIAAEVVLRELIAPYPDLPVTVGVIGADVDDRYGPPEAARARRARALCIAAGRGRFASYTHPYQWSFFENYDRELEERLIGPDESEWMAVLGDARAPTRAAVSSGLGRKTAGKPTMQGRRRRPASRIQRFPVRPR